LARLKDRILRLNAVFSTQPESAQRGRAHPLF